VAKLCERAGFTGNFSNHSLRATAATRLYASGLDEQLISEKTGHRSNAVQAYKRTSEAQMLAVSDIVQSKKLKTATVTSSSTSTEDNTPGASDTDSKEICITTPNVSIKVSFK
jgi:hypothetical protein